MKFLDRKDLKALASTFQVCSNLDETKDEIPDWVVQAMEEAYIRGLEDCSNLHRRTMDCLDKT